MKILQICLRVPFPTRDGGSMAMASLAEGLKLAGADLRMLAFNTSKHFIEEDRIQEEVAEYNMRTPYLDNSISPVNAAINLLGSKPFHVSRFYNEEIDKELEQLLADEAFDGVIFESIFTAPYLATVRKHSKAVCLLRSHNIEFKIWEGVAQETSNPIKGAYLKLQLERLRKYEIEMTGAFDLVGAITSVDEAFYKTHNFTSAAFTLPFGITPRPREVRNVQEQLVIGFLGSMDWMPNQEGIRWFVKEIWPSIAQKFPKVVCKIAGRHMPKDILAYSDSRLQIEGEVPNARAFIKGLDLTIVPLRSGSGVRIKVLESMANGIPVIATAIGYEGVNAVSGTSIMEANNADAFVSAIEELMSNPDKLELLSKKAVDLVKAEHDKKHIAEDVLQRIQTLNSVEA